MIVDSSAIMAILLGEAEQESFVGKIVAADAPRISAGNWIELAAVQARLQGAATSALDELVDALGIDIAPVTVAQARIGQDAYRRFGRGTGHPARLNFGDCFAYALAKESGEPLLFKGDDFARTDVAAA